MFTAAGLPPGHLYYDCGGPEGGSAQSSRSVIFLRDGAALRLYCGGEHRFPLTQSPQDSFFFGFAYLWYLWSISSAWFKRYCSNYATQNNFCPYLQTVDCCVTTIESNSVWSTDDHHVKCCWIYTGLPFWWIKQGRRHVLKCFATWSRIDNDFNSTVILLGLEVKVFVGVDPERLNISAVTAGIKREWNQKSGWYGWVLDITG